MTKDRLIYLPLGGAGEVGMNAYVYGYGAPGKERLILVDMGVTFPDMDSTPGVDVIMADSAWLEQNAARIVMANPDLRPEMVEALTGLTTGDETVVELPHLHGDDEGHDHDDHVDRYRLTVVDVLERVVPDAFKRDAHHWLILHGRYVCKARSPDCRNCAIHDLCRWPDKTG